MMNIQLTAATTEDTVTILRLMEAFCVLDGYAFDEALRRKNISRLITDHELGRLWIIRLDGTSIGYVALTFGFSFEFHGRDAFVDELYLDEAHRGKGIGGNVLDIILEQAPSIGVEAIHLEVEKHNERGKRLYLRKGFYDHNRFLMTKFIEPK